MRRRHCRGLSMVELLVGTAVGLLVVATASMLVAQHLRDHRALTIETRLMQDLRSTADMVSRDLRRAGYWGHAASGVAGDDGMTPAANPYAEVWPAASASDAVGFRYSRDAAENDVVDDNEQFGFRLRNGAVELQLGAANWQALTDATTLTVTAFSIAPHTEESSLEAFCNEPCLAGSTTCPPKQQVRSFAISIAGRSALDASVVRDVRGEARLRNTSIVGRCGS
jgi:type IV pilus assembly protein PilW